VIAGHHLPGAPYEHVFFVADTEATGSMVPGELNVYLLRDGFHLFFPMRGRPLGASSASCRSTSGKSRTSLSKKRSPRCRRRPERSSPSALQLVFELPHPSSLRRAFPRRALLPARRRGARLHSPMGGQGMKHGTPGRYNLAWKLALVVSGKADAALLDSYASERIPVATGCCAPPTARSRWSFPTAVSRGCSAPRSSRGSPPSR